MKFLKDQVVRIKFQDSFTKGIVLEEGKGFNIDGPYYWVSYEHDQIQDVILFNEVDLIRWNYPEELCVCGSNAVGSDRHSSWCAAYEV